MAKMSLILPVTIAFLAPELAYSAVINRPLPANNPVNSTYKYETDQPTPLPFVNWNCDTKFTTKQIKSGIIGEEYRWRDGLFIYLDRSFRNREYKIINAAVRELSSHLCIPVKIWPRNSQPEGDYVEIIRGGADSGCWSNVGRQGGRQTLNLQFNRCIQKYVVMHELIHALGFFHEMGRMDRDKYVEVFYENILPRKARNFDKMDSLNFGVEYDYHSIMHYHSLAFSRNGKPTILSKNGSIIGSNKKLTDRDIEKLKRMYDCKT